MEYKSHWKDTEEHWRMCVDYCYSLTKNNLEAPEKKFIKVTYSIIKIIVHV